MRHGDADILRTSARAKGHFHQAVRDALELRDFWRARRDSNSRPSDSKSSASSNIYITPYISGPRNCPWILYLYTLDPQTRPQI